MLNTPTTDIVLPDDLQKAIEAARVNLATLESKASILTNVNKATSKTNETLLKEQVYFEENIKRLTEESKELEQKVRLQRKESDELSLQNRKTTDEIEAKKLKQTELETEYRKRVEELKKDRDVLTLDQEKLSKDREVLSQEEEKLKNKILKFQEFISNLN